jgi:hypothetical protein
MIHISKKSHILQNFIEYNDTYKKEITYNIERKVYPFKYATLFVKKDHFRFNSHTRNSHNENHSNS